MGWKVVWERTQPALQELVDQAPKAKQYFSEAFEAYDRLWYHLGRYEISDGKTDTFSVEADNAELRHYRRDWPDRRDAFRVALMHWNAP